ncbi:lipoate--protein ligase [Clostridiales bacterium COT073_COT-073]|nr:lipoate--protein ligase [Clostridiales bacterium COT073_COT-073]
MKYNLVKNTGHNPYHNIALEKYLFDICAGDEIILYLWVNQPCVIAGCNQNVLLEWDNTFLKENEIYPVRRLTGGGCVYHDLGNLNYSFISGLEHKDIEKWLKIILDAVSSFGLSVGFSGRNDLVMDDRKFGGTAWLEEDNKILFHGTLMLNVDLEQMVKCLTPDLLKFEGKAIASVRSRVVNLSDKADELNTDRLIQAIERSFSQVYGELTDKSVQDNSDIEQMVRKLSSPEWIYQKNSDCDISVSYKVKNQLVQLDLKIENNRITDLNVFTDSLEVMVADKIKQHLCGLVYSETDIPTKLSELLEERVGISEI